MLKGKQQDFGVRTAREYGVHNVHQCACLAGSGDSVEQHVAGGRPGVAEHGRRDGGDGLRLLDACCHVYATSRQAG